MHHKRRYDNVITVTAHFYGADITEAEKETARKLMQALASKQFKSVYLDRLLSAKKKG